ncbi:MAG: hypothetical protein U0168_06715 [Nannocystaceae bacterium]
MSVRSERNGPVTTIVLSRPDVRNAVDRDTCCGAGRAVPGLRARRGRRGRGAVG